MWWRATKERWKRAAGCPEGGRSPLPGAAAEASTPTVGVDASTLGLPGLGLTTVVRCVESNTEVRPEVRIDIGELHVGLHVRGKGQRRRTVLWKALEGTTIHTQDYNEPPNTNLRGGELVYQRRVVDTTALYRKREEEDGAAESGTTAVR